MLGEILATLKTHQGEELHDYNPQNSPLDRQFGLLFGKEFGIKFGDNDKQLLLLLNSNPALSATELAGRIGITKRGVKKQIKKFRELQIIERVSSNKTGYWKIKRVD